MKKIFYSLAIALVALMVSLPAKATIHNASTIGELYCLMSQGQDQHSGVKVQATDTIRIVQDITWAVSVDFNFYLYVPSNTVRSLDLNGHTLRHNAVNVNYNFAIYMSSNSTLNVYDTQGEGRIINYASSWFLPTQGAEGYEYSLDNETYRINSACILIERKPNCTINLYAGKLIAIDRSSGEDDKCSVIHSIGEKVFKSAYGESKIYYNGGFDVQDNNVVLNMYGGYITSHISKKYTLSVYKEEYQEGKAQSSYTRFDKDIYTNLVKINLYGGEIGKSNADYPGLNYPKGFSGTLKDGTIYGIASEDHLNNFNAVADGVKVYLNGTQTTVNALKTQDLADKIVRFAYEPEISVSGIAVTKDNCDDILGDGKVSFDIASNTLYLKTKDASALNTLTGNIVFDDFNLNIVVDGKWKINGRIVGHDGHLVISPAHYSLTEEDADLLAIHSQNSTAVSLNGKSFCAKNRVRVVIDDNNTYTQTAVSCGMFVITNAWFDAWGKKPVVDCTSPMISKATVKTGSVTNDVIQIEPNRPEYVVHVASTDDKAGKTTGNGTVKEGDTQTVTATAFAGYHFLRWSDGVTENPYTFVVMQDTVLWAYFEPDVVINYYDIRVASADETMGWVEGGALQLEQGQKVTIKAYPRSGYEFLYWMDSREQVQSGDAIYEVTVTGDETYTAYFRVAPPADAYNLWVCGTQVTGSNSRDILGDGVWSYDYDTHTLTVMKDATYNLTNNEFISDFVSGVGTLTINVGNHKLEATCTTTDEVIRTAIWSSNAIIFTGTTYHGLTFTAQNMYPANVKTLTVTGHMDLTINLKNTTEFGKKWFSTAVLLGGVTPSLIVNGANLYINSGVGESAGSGYKATNKTDQAANLSMNNASIQWGSISSHDLGILDDSPKYEINYLTPALESLCLTSAFGLSFFEGTHFNLYAYPAPGYKFVSWSDGNTDNPRLIIMPAQNVYLDPIVEVDDSQTPKGAIINASATEGQGSIIGFTSGWYAEGTQLSITAQAAEGYEFVQWSDGETANPYILTVENGKNVSITAVFCEKGQGIEDIRVEGDKPQKILHEGQIYIFRGGKIYTVQGAQMK